MEEKNKYRIDPKFDCEYTKEMVCPYCGEEQSDSWESVSNDDDYGSTSCESCDKQFEFNVQRDINYSTSCIEGEHTFVVNNWHIEDMQTCERCGFDKFARYDK